MGIKTNFFAREQRLFTHDQMMDKLAERTKVSGSGVAQSSRAPFAAEVPGANPVAAPARPVLAWADPVKHGDGSGFQLSVGGLFSVTKTRSLGEFVYTVFRRLPSPTPIGTAISSQEGRALAQRYFEDHP